MKTATKKASKKNTLVESDSRRGAYDFWQTRAIIQHHSLGRLLIVQGFGGMDSLEGGTYRWKHGSAYKIDDTATIESLYKSDPEYGYSAMDGAYPENYKGFIIAKIASSVGL